MRTPGEPSAPRSPRRDGARRRRLPDGAEPCGHARADEARERGARDGRSRLHGRERGGEERADDEEHLLDRRLERVGRRAQVAGREPWPHDPHGRRDRRVDERRRSAAAIAMGTAPASSPARTIADDEQRGVEHGADAEDGAGPRTSTRRPRIGAPAPRAIAYTATTTPAAPYPSPSARTSNSSANGVIPSGRRASSDQPISDFADGCARSSR